MKTFVIQTVPTTVVVGKTATTVVDQPTPAIQRVNTTSIEVVVDRATRQVISTGQQGLPGPQGEKGDTGTAGGTSEQRTAATALGGHRMVRAESDGRVGYASNDNPLHGDDTIGMTLGAALVGDPIEVQYHGVVAHTGWAWIPGEPVFLGRDGMPTQAASAAGDAFVQLIGFAETATSLHLQIDSSIYL